MIKGKSLQSRIFYPARLLLKCEKEIKSFTYHQKLGNSAPGNQLFKNFSRYFSSWKGKDKLEIRKLRKEKNLISKRKYIVKILDQPLIKLVGNLKNKSSKIIYSHSK